MFSQDSVLQHSQHLSRPALGVYATLDVAMLAMP